MKSAVKRILGIASASLVTLGMAACGAGGNSSQAEGEITLSFWHSTSGGAADALDEIVSKFNEDHKGKIKIDAVYQGGYGDAIAKLANSVQAGNIPDIMQINDANTTYIYDTGVTVPAQDLNDAAEQKADFDDLLPSVRQYYSKDGKLMSMPFMASHPGLFINPDIVAAAGLDPANPPKNRAELIEWATQIKEKPGKHGIVFHIGSWWFESWTASEGLEFCTPQNGLGDQAAEKFQLAAPEQVAVWSDFQKLYKNDIALNVSTDGKNSQAAFANGEAGMIITSSASLGNLQKNAQGFEPMAVHFPIDNPSNGGVVAGGNSVWVFGKDPKGAKEQAAWTFLSYLPSAEAQGMIFKHSGYLPISNSAVKELEPQADEARSVLLKQIADNPSNTVTGGCHSGAIQQVREELGDALQSILNDGADPAVTLKKVEDDSIVKVKEYNDRAASQR